MGKPILLDQFGIALTEQKVVEFSGNRPGVTIPLKEIHRVEIQYGFSSERPLIGALFGLFLSGIGLVGCYRAIMTVINEGVFFFPFLAMIPFVVIGIWVLYKCFAQGYFLRVDTSRGSRKLNFDHRIKPGEASEFANNWNQLELELKCGFEESIRS